MLCWATPLAAISASFRPLSLCLALLFAVAWTPTARAQTLDPLAVDIFFDLVGEDLERIGAKSGYDAPESGTVVIAGIPLRIGAQEGQEDVGRHMMTGAEGRCALSLGDRLAVVGTARIAMTDFIDVAQGVTTASGAAEFRYAHDGWKLSLKPGFEIARDQAGAARRDSVIESRTSKALAGGFSFAATSRYRWSEATAGGGEDREIAAGRIGLARSLADFGRMEVAYVGRQEIAETGAALRSMGPSVAVALPLDRTLDLTVNYDFRARTGYDATDAQPDGSTQDLHQLGVALTWDMGFEANEFLLSAGYKYERLSVAAGGQDEARHSGAVSLAFVF